MKYILDFDETIFDAKKFKQILVDCSIEETSVSAETFNEIKKIFPDFDIKSLLFKDALDFLEAHAGDCQIVSTYLSVDPEKNNDFEKRKAFQAEKIALCGVTKLLGEEKIHLVGDSKMEKLQELKELHDGRGEQCVFVDDSERWTRQAESIGMRAYTMKREHTFGTFENLLSMCRRESISSFLGFEERVAEDTK